MLLQLSVRDFAIAEHIDLSFERGMTVISGETGAGKSILLDALGLTLGDRATADSVRHGADRADISAVFDISAIPEAQAWLKENDLDQGHECILRRVISADGKSRGYINGQPSPLQMLREVGEMLMDIHSQHEHQSLLKKETHRRLLDSFGHLQEQVERVQQTYREWQAKSKRLHQLAGQSEETEARVQLLTYQVQELDQLGLREGEVEELEQEQERLSQAESILESCHAAVQACKEDDESSSSRIRFAINRLQPVRDTHPAIANAVKLLEEAEIQVEEACADLRHFADDFEADPARLQEVEERLSSIFQLARKHRTTPEGLLALQQDLSRELESLAGGEQSLEQLEAEVAQLTERYLAAARTLSAQRQQTATKFDALVQDKLKQLHMPSMRFESQLQSKGDAPEQFAPHGLEDIEFLISPNPGQPAKPLTKIASGGELSRISLAIQVVAAQVSSIPSLVFDEVDVGIGGGTAEVVGRMLRSLGEKGQVFCVTHQPQVASQGHHHLFVSKRLSDNQTHSQINKLDAPERIREVARMLGGIEMTEQTLAHAEEMLEKSQAR